MESNQQQARARAAAESMPDVVGFPRRPREPLAEGEVIIREPHLVLRWPGGRTPPYRERSAIALVGRGPGPGGLVMQWLDAPLLAPHHLAEARDDVRVELQCYLVDRDHDDPFAFARQHTRDRANAASCVYWSYVDPAGRARPERTPRRAASIRVHCPRCAAPTRLDATRRFACTSCRWHD